MNYLLLIVGFVAVAQCGASKPIVIMDSKFVAQISEKAIICSKEAGVGSELLANLLPWRLEENETNGKILLCLSKELKCDGENGHLNVDNFIGLLESSLKDYDVEEFKQIARDCNEEVGKNQYYTIYKIVNCFHEKSPVDMAIQ